MTKGYIKTVAFLLTSPVLGMAALPALAQIPAASSFSPLHALPEVRSSNGVLEATLDVQAQTIDLGSVHFNGMTYNGDYASPLLRVHPGDVIHLKLINHLSEISNIHFHGLHSSPQGRGDNIYTVIQPGDSFDYEVKIPATQPPGLYWYHPHIHGQSERMVNQGLSGPILVEGIKQQIPSLADVNEQTLLLKEYRVEETTDPALEYMHKIVQTMNGQLLSSIAMRKGETQLWHILNAGADDVMHLTIKDHKFRIIGRDGVPATRETVTDRLDINPAARLDVLVDAGNQSGNFDLISEGVPTGFGEQKIDYRNLGMIAVSGNAVSAVPPLTAFPPRQDLRQQVLDEHRTIMLSQNVDKDEYYLDGLLFDHHRVDLRVPLGHIEEWTIVNDSDDAHYFHIHQLHFQVTEINGEPVPFNGYLDTVRVREHSVMKVIMPFNDPTIVGKFVYHCHVLEHEDKGMMAVVEVYDPTRENPMLSWWKNSTTQLGTGFHICGARSQSLWQRLKSLLA